MSIFSFYGRATRTHYGVFFLITIGAYFAMGLPYFVWLLKTDQGQILEKMQSDPKTAHLFDAYLKIPIEAVYVAFAVCALALVILYIAWIAMSVRRLHDMGTTGWLVLIAILIALFPILGYLLVSLVLGLWPGAKGSNRYGTDPRARLELGTVFERGPYPSRSL